MYYRGIERIQTGLRDQPPMRMEDHIAGVPAELADLAREWQVTKCWVFTGPQWLKVLEVVRLNPMRYGLGQW